MPYPILDPTGTTATATRGHQGSRAPHAPRRRDLRGATVGLLVNTKQNAAPFLDEVGRLLVQQHGASGTMARTKVKFAAPAPEDLIKEVTTACHGISTGSGDGGSRRAWAVPDGIAFEADGLPAAAICSDAFRVTAEAMAELRGAPG